MMIDGIIGALIKWHVVTSCGNDEPGCEIAY